MRALVDGEAMTLPGAGGRGDDAALTERTWGEERGDADGLMVFWGMGEFRGAEAGPDEVVAVRGEVDCGAVDAP